MGPNSPAVRWQLIYSGDPGNALQEGGHEKPPDGWASSLHLPCTRFSPGVGSQDLLFPTVPPTSSLGLGPRLLPMAAGGPGGTLGLGSTRIEGPATPCVEAVTARRVASCFHSRSQQAEEVAAPEGAGGHGGVLRGGPQRHILAWALAGMPLLQGPRPSGPQLPAGSPQPHASSLATGPDPSPPPLSSSGSRPSLPRSFRSPLLPF